MDEAAAVEVQLGRPLRAESPVVSRCHLAMPVVIEVPPILDDGTPFPTRFWLTCPLARLRISRLESAGGIKAMERRVATDPEFAGAVEAAHRRYETDRDSLIPVGTKNRPSGGVGGTMGLGVKCLHAHYADTRAGGDNPVGTLVAPWVEPLDCQVPCVISDEGQVVDNPAWKEPQ